jgi:hypothetical protein
MRFVAPSSSSLSSPSSALSSSVGTGHRAGALPPRARGAFSSLPVVVAMAAWLVGGLASCGVPPPDRLEVVPPTMIKNTETGVVTKLGAQAYRGVATYDDSKAPLVVTWTSSDPTVAIVDAGGAVTSTGSGKAKITASVAGAGGAAVTADVDVNNLIVSVIEANGEFPKVFTLDSKPVPLSVVVKDEKGNVIAQPRLSFRASDHCIEVTPEGVVHPLAVGECSAIIECGGKTTRIDLDVKG